MGTTTQIRHCGCKPHELFFILAVNCNECGLWAGKRPHKNAAPSHYSVGKGEVTGGNKGKFITFNMKANWSECDDEVRSIPADYVSIVKQVLLWV
jgi:hypothetical protein